jgi:hypothetical protein
MWNNEKDEPVSINDFYKEVCKNSAIDLIFSDGLSEKEAIASYQKKQIESLMDDTLECPFCGNLLISHIKTPLDNGINLVGCISCGAVARSVKDWNRRNKI